MSAVTDYEPELGPNVTAAVVPAVPRPPRRRDNVLAILLAASLAVHLTVFLPSLLGMGKDKETATPREIPIELVQLPPKPAEKPKPPPQAAKPQQPKQQPKQQAAQRKPQPPKQDAQKKPEPPKPAQKPKQEAQKKAEPPKPQKPAQKSVADRMRSLLPISSGALAMPGASADGTDSVSYEDLVLSKVAKAKDDERHKGDPAQATVAFLLDDKGGVAAVMITQASGNPWLDDEAIAMIKRGAPYPPPPPGAKRDFQVTLSLHRV